MAQNISVKEAAGIMGKSQQFVRVGLQRGLLPFGTAVKLSSIWTYYISPKLFYEYVGEAEEGGQNGQISISRT
jgi:hypothetical protein